MHCDSSWICDAPPEGDHRWYPVMLLNLWCSPWGDHRWYPVMLMNLWCSSWGGPPLVSSNAHESVMLPLKGPPWYPVMLMNLWCSSWGRPPFLPLSARVLYLVLTFCVATTCRFAESKIRSWILMTAQVHLLPPEINSLFVQIYGFYLSNLFIVW